jgi:membrane-associated phospholipid phosphatase
MAVDVAHLETASADEPTARAIEQRRDGSWAPLLEPTPGGAAERFAASVSPGHPIRVFLAAILTGYAILLALTIAAGFLLTKVILKIDGVSAWDERFSRALVKERSGTTVDASWVGSTLAGGLVIPALVGLLLVVFLISKHWRLAAFTLFVICVESGTYRATSLVVHRDRPDVKRLESLPVDASYPSGHTAASVALLGGLLIVLASRIHNTAIRIVLWTLAVGIPVFVAWSRMLRGMHHITDVAAGVLMGIAALCITIFAARAAGAAAAQRDAAGTSISTESTEGKA